MAQVSDGITFINPCEYTSYETSLCTCQCWLYTVMQSFDVINPYRPPTAMVHAPSLQYRAEVLCIGSLFNKFDTSNLNLPPCPCLKQLYRKLKDFETVLIKFCTGLEQ
jgi:hypothetical protein